MNILLAFKAEPDPGMLAEKDWQAATADTRGPDVSLLRCSPGADEQAAAALLLAQRNGGCKMTLTALSIGDERALHWLRYFVALGFETAGVAGDDGRPAVCSRICRQEHCRLAA